MADRACGFKNELGMRGRTSSKVLERDGTQRQVAQLEKLLAIDYWSAREAGTVVIRFS